MLSYIVIEGLRGYIDFDLRKIPPIPGSQAPRDIITDTDESTHMTSNQNAIYYFQATD